MLVGGLLADDCVLIEDGGGFLEEGWELDEKD